MHKNETRSTLGTVLLASERPAALSAAQTALAESGYGTTTASDPEIAVQIAARSTVRATIVDLGNESSAGYEILDAIRSSVPSETMPILCLSHQTGEGHRRFLTELGADDLLGKPIEGQELVDRLDRLLSRASRQTTMRGDLKTLSVIDLLQMLLLQRQSGLLRIRSSSGTGTVTASDGQIIGASFGGQQGEPAAIAMACLNQGSFSFHSTESTGRVINEWSKSPIPFERIVVEAARQRSAAQPPEAEPRRTPSEPQASTLEPPPLDDSAPNLSEAPLEVAVAPVMVPRLPPRRPWINTKALRIAFVVAALMAASAGLYVAAGARLSPSPPHSVQAVERSTSTTDSRPIPAGERATSTAVPEVASPAPSAVESPVAESAVTETVSQVEDLAAPPRSVVASPPTQPTVGADRGAVIDNSVIDKQPVSEAVELGTEAAAKGLPAAPVPATAKASMVEVADITSGDSDGSRRAAQPVEPPPSEPFPPESRPSESPQVASASLPKKTIAEADEQEVVEPTPPPASTNSVERDAPATDRSLPARLIDEPTLVFPHAMRIRIPTDRIDLRVLVDEQGQVAQVEILGDEELPAFAVERVMKAARRARFEPAREQDLAVPSWTTLSLPLAR